MLTSKLSIVWWNTSLSPPVSSKRGKSTIEKINNVCGVLKQFMTLGYDFICLGEVCDQDIDYFLSNLTIEKFNYSIVRGAKKLNRSYFDTCILYKKEHLLIPQFGEDTKYLSFDSGTNTLKTGIKYVFGLAPPFSESLAIYLCHWPSKLRNVNLDVGSISERCRIDVELQLKNVDNIILMGDFNIEPYEIPLVHNMQTSRDKKLVLDKPNILYNPFWKFLSSGSDGTYHYPSGRFHRNLVIDQIIFSSSFLGGKWEFNDDWINIVDAVSDGFSIQQISDHLPVVGIVGRKVNA